MDLYFLALSLDAGGNSAMDWHPIQGGVEMRGKITEGKKAGRASKTRQHPLPLNLRSGSPLSRFMLQKPE